MSSNAAATAPWRERLRVRIEDRRIQRVIIALILINAVVLGLETSPVVMAAAGPALLALDKIILGIFVIELILRMTAYGWRFFRDPWSVFDFLVVAIALVPASEAFDVLRSLRVLRVLRLISAVPRMRRVVGALLGAIPGIGAIVALLGLVFYVAAVMATKLFGENFPEWFGTLGRSLYTLFQVMTLESWSMGIVRPVMEVHPYSWIFFVPFILIATFTVLNLFIAVVVNAMQDEHSQEQENSKGSGDDQAVLLAELRALRLEVTDLGREIAVLRQERGDGVERR